MSRFPGQFDCVVMLTWSNWRSEPRSNRYHYGSRFAPHVPVLFVQPDDAATPVEPSELPGLSIVHVGGAYSPTQLDPVVEEMRRRGLRRPLVWIYNPNYHSLRQHFPDAVHVFHATEDYSISPGYTRVPAGEARYELYKWRALLKSRIVHTLEGCSLVVCVSEGVAKGIRSTFAYGGEVAVLENGCDYAFWTSGAKAGRRDRVALYQGGINDRLDLPLLLATMRALPDWEFRFCGVVAPDFPGLKALQAEKSFRYLGVLGAEELREEMHAATVGLIPYVHDPIIVDRSLPLKAFEYAACGLPVATVPISALAGHPRVFSFARDAREFADAILAAPASAADPAASAARLAAARAHDYDRRFEELLALLGKRLSPPGATLRSRIAMRLLVWRAGWWARLVAAEQNRKKLRNYLPHEVAPGAAPARSGPEEPQRLRIALLAVCPSRTAGTISDHVRAFGQFSRHRVVLLQNMLALVGPHFGAGRTVPQSFPLESFDVLVLHYSNYLALPSHLDAASAERIRNFRGLKVAFIQDEYRTVDATNARLRELAVDALFTCVPQGEIEKVYSPDALPGLRVEQTLTGFVPKELTRLKVPPLDARPVDVGYRARKVPYWLGELGEEKWRIAAGFLQATASYGLRCDISYREEDRIYGDVWIRFLSSCRTVLGAESGASVFDFTGDIQRNVDDYVRRNPVATFEEVRRLFFAAEEGRIRLNQISPRSFESAALRSGMVLFEGEYSGILHPRRHYIPIRKDFSNIEEVVDAIRDTPRVQRMVDCAYEEIAMNPAYSYEAFVRRFDAVVDEEWARRCNHRPSGARRQRYAGAMLRFRAAAVLWHASAIWPPIAMKAWASLPFWLRQKIKPVIKKMLRKEGVA